MGKKLLLFSDVHCDINKCKLLEEKSRDADIVVCAGDLGNIRSGLEYTIDALKEIQKPTILVPGNSENYSELTAACKNWPSAIVLHGNGINAQGVEFYGIGGGIPVTPFGAWSYDFSEEEARDLLKDCPDEGVLISHSPPKGALDVSSTGRSLGSVAVREAILQRKPKLVVCGHIHASSGKQSILGNSVIVNAGPSGMFWELFSENRI